MQPDPDPARYRPFPALLVHPRQAILLRDAKKSASQLLVGPTVKAQINVKAKRKKGSNHLCFPNPDVQNWTDFSFRRRYKEPVLSLGRLPQLTDIREYDRYDY
jgi:hypothetical protein